MQFILNLYNSLIFFLYFVKVYYGVNICYDIRYVKLGFFFLKLGEIGLLGYEIRIKKIF